MIDPPRILQTVAQATAVIHITVPRAQIGHVMGPGLQELMQTLAKQGITPAGPWCTHHLKMPSDVFDFHLSVPVPRPVAPAGRVANGQLPAATVARTVYRGPYEGLPAAWGEFMKWITAQGHTPAATLWETYLTDPSTNPDPNSWQTELTRPLERVSTAASTQSDDCKNTEKFPVPNSGKLKVAAPGDREIAMTRTFNAPRHLVFKALTTPELVKRWLGVFGGWSLAVCEIDLRVGGKYRYLWRGADGAEMGMGGIYREITPPERIVATEAFDQAWYPGDAIV
ncbi:MAG: transcriptional regulator, effector-binding domain/component, partial [Phycisphaerales bacterium]|nr:transcriptional regulator, effector-binding domain/component [Phycisphaerales bacterium]